MNASLKIRGEEMRWRVVDVGGRSRNVGGGAMIGVLPTAFSDKSIGQNYANNILQANKVGSTNSDKSLEILQTRYFWISAEMNNNVTCPKLYSVSGLTELSFVGWLKKNYKWNIGNEIWYIRYIYSCVLLTNPNNISADIVEWTPLILIFEKDSYPNFIIDSNRLQKIEIWLPPSSSMAQN